MEEDRGPAWGVARVVAGLVVPVQRQDPARRPLVRAAHSVAAVGGLAFDDMYFVVRRALDVLRDEAFRFDDEEVVVVRRLVTLVDGAGDAGAKDMAQAPDNCCK